MELESLFSRKIGMGDINCVVEWSRTAPGNRDMLWNLARRKERRVSANALWVMTHLPESDKDWLISLQDEIIDMLLVEKDTSKKRMLLQLLREQDFDPDEMRTDLLDFCLSKINSECEPYALPRFMSVMKLHGAQQFFILPNSLIDKLSEHVGFELWGPRGEIESIVRFVTDWSTTEDDVISLLRQCPYPSFLG